MALGPVTARSYRSSNNGRRLERNRKFADSPLEGDGFELLVPRHENLGFSRGKLVISRFSACLSRVTPRAYHRRIEE